MTHDCYYKILISLRLPIIPGGLNVLTQFLCFQLQVLFPQIRAHRPTLVRVFWDIAKFRQIKLLSAKNFDFVF